MLEIIRMIQINSPLQNQTKYFKALIIWTKSCLECQNWMVKAFWNYTKYHFNWVWEHLLWHFRNVSKIYTWHKKKIIQNKFIIVKELPWLNLIQAFKLMELFYSRTWKMMKHKYNGSEYWAIVFKSTNKMWWSIIA